MATRDIEYFSDGVRMAGWISIPEGVKPTERRPAVLLCSGLFGLKDWVPPRFSPSFIDDGFVTMSFDYRGFGASDGVRGVIDPEMEIRDIRNSVTYLLQQPEVDPERVGVLGWGLGGGIAISAAARDDRIRAVVTANGPGDVGRVTRNDVAYVAWLDAQKMLEADRVQRVLTGKSKMIHWEGLTHPGGGFWRDEQPEKSVFNRALQGLGEEVTPEFSLASAEALYSFRPEEEVQKISPRPLLVVHGTDDPYMSVDEAKSVFALADEPKTMYLIKGEGHLELIEPGNPNYLPTVKKIVDWFKNAM